MLGTPHECCTYSPSGSAGLSIEKTLLTKELILSKQNNGRASVWWASVVSKSCWYAHSLTVISVLRLSHYQPWCINIEARSFCETISFRRTIVHRSKNSILNRFTRAFGVNDFAFASSEQFWSCQDSVPFATSKCNSNRCQSVDANFPFSCRPIFSFLAILYRYR